MAAAFGPRSGVRLSGGLGGPHYGRYILVTRAPACRPRGVWWGSAARGSGVWWRGRRAVGRTRRGCDHATPKTPIVYSSHDACGPPNGMPLSCAAIIHRDHARVEIGLQNGRNLRAAQRRRLERRVGRPALRTLDHADTSAKLVGRAGYGGEARRGVVGYGVWGAARGGRGRSERARSLNRHTCTPTTMPAGHPTPCPSAAPPPIDRDNARADSTFKKAPILGTRSGVGCMGMLARNWLFSAHSKDFDLLKTHFCICYGYDITAS